MLKLFETLRNGSFRLAPRSSAWCISNYQTVSACSSVATASQKKVHKKTVNKSDAPSDIKKKSNFSMVQLVFDSLENNFNNARDQNQSEESKMILELLLLADRTDINYDRAKFAVDTLHQWVKDGRIQPKEFEDNPKYHKLYKMYVNGATYRVERNNNKTLYNSEIYPVDGITEPFTNISRMSINEAIKVLSGLAAKHQRTKPLLVAVASNISRSEATLSIKNISDILYSMSLLSFTDTTLLQKLCKDLEKSVATATQSPIIGSIVTSLGMMRYRNDEVLDKISKWVVAHKDILRIQDLCALLMTLATVGYNPVNSDVLFQELVSPLTETDMIRSSEWLDVVWALTILNQVTPVQLESVLNTKYISKLLDPDEIPLVKRRKLLNVNTFAKLLMKNYSGPFLPENSVMLNAPTMNKKDKQIFVKAIVDALANLFPSKDHFRVNVDVDTGFILDIEFFMDKKCTPLIHDKVPEHTDALRIAVVANHYHDYCVGENCLLGPVRLHYQLLEAKGYRLLDISHTEFHTDDKLLTRISYINDRIKSVVK